MDTIFWIFYFLGNSKGTFFYTFFVHFQGIEFVSSCLIWYVIQLGNEVLLASYWKFSQIRIRKIPIHSSTRFSIFLDYIKVNVCIFSVFKYFFCYLTRIYFLLPRNNFLGSRDWVHFISPLRANDYIIQINRVKPTFIDKLTCNNLAFFK